MGPNNKAPTPVHADTQNRFDPTEHTLVGGGLDKVAMYSCMEGSGRCSLGSLGQSGKEKI